jgi:signal transduction histidine kinase
MDEIVDDHRVLQVRSWHQDDAVVVTVEDSGPGIAPENFDRIFEAFVTTKPQGMGLGLAICRMIIERHAGQLSASPVHPHGTMFRIVLTEMKLPH